MPLSEEGCVCPSLRCSWPRRGLGVGARGAEVVGAEALEWLPSERDKAPAQEETPERQWPEGPSGSGQRGRAAMLRSLPLGPPPASSLRPHIQAWSEPSLLLTPPLVRASGKPCTVRHTHHKGPRVPQPPPTAGAGKRARPPAV